MHEAAQSPCVSPFSAPRSPGDALSSARVGKKEVTLEITEKGARGGGRWQALRTLAASLEMADGDREPGLPDMMR